MALKSQTEIKKALKRILKESDELKARAKERGSEFVSLTPKQITKKLRGETSNSPFFTAQSWDQFASPGSPCFFLANYINPDPQLRFCVVTIFFGLTNLIPDIGAAIAARDTAWPYTSTEVVFLNTGETGVADFKYPVPFGPKGTYFGNAILWEWTIGGRLGAVFDRATPFYVTLK